MAELTGKNSAITTEDWHYVAGKTVARVSGQDSRVALLFSVRCLSASNRLGPRWRRHVFAHEEGHVYDAVAQTPPDRSEQRAGLSAARDTFAGPASRVLSEYRAERWAIDSDARAGIPPTTWFNLPRPVFEADAESLTHQVEALRKYTDQRCKVFLDGKMPYDGCCGFLLGMLQSILTFAAYTTARDDALSRGMGALKRVEGDPKYSFFTERWKTIRTHLRPLYAIPFRRDEAELLAVARDIEGLYRSCGVDVIGTSSGVVIRVRSPGFESLEPTPRELSNLRIDALKDVSGNRLYPEAMRRLAQDILDHPTADAVRGT